ncbi:hypothetical protein ACFQX7_27985 [Luedemannella flava]
MSPWPSWLRRLIIVLWVPIGSRSGCATASCIRPPYTAGRPACGCSTSAKPSTVLACWTWQPGSARHRPDHDRVAHLLGLYVAAGGHPDALASRGGLPAATWALGWHRVWAAAWFIEQAATGAFDATTDTAHGVIVHRQLTSAAALLRC